MDATDRLHELQEQRQAVRARVDQLERDYREAVAAQRDAGAAGAEADRLGVSATKRQRLEEALPAAKARADQPWPERIAGAQDAIRDADRLLREHVAAHLVELVATKEIDGEASAARVDRAAAELVAAYQEREAVAAELGQLITWVRRPQPGDVSFSRADEAYRAAAALLAGGGEVPVTLARDRPPWDLLLGEDEATAEFAGTDGDEPEPVIGVVA
jgi:hypothetical protein